MCPVYPHNTDYNNGGSEGQLLQVVASVGNLFRFNVQLGVGP